MTTRLFEVVVRIQVENEQVRFAEEMEFTTKELADILYHCVELNLDEEAYESRIRDNYITGMEIDWDSLKQVRPA